MLIVNMIGPRGTHKSKWPTAKKSFHHPIYSTTWSYLFSPSEHLQYSGTSPYPPHSNSFSSPRNKPFQTRINHSFFCIFQVFPKFKKRHFPFVDLNQSKPCKKSSTTSSRCIPLQKKATKSSKVHSSFSTSSNPKSKNYQNQQRKIRHPQTMQKLRVSF
jgi:hypothetical protein